MGNTVYDSQLDRYDVAIRAVIKLYRSGKWPLLAQLGLNRKQHAGPIDEALLDIGYPSPGRGEAVLFRFIRACPFLVPAATELLACYWGASALSREFAYRQSGRRAS